MAEASAQRLRWDTVDDEATLPGTGERVTHPEFRGIEFLHVRAKSLLNHVPAAAGMRFEWTINTYRGCTHACTYCASPDTLVLMADGRTRRIADVRIGDRVYGTERRGTYRRYVTTEVTDHWRTIQHAFRVTLADGTVLVTSGAHRFLTERGWKHVADVHVGQRPHLTAGNRLRGTGGYAEGPKLDDDYRRGYLAGMIRGDGTIEDEVVDRRARFVAELGGGPTRDEPWPDVPQDGWWRGFLAGIFDAEGGCSQGVLRLANTDAELLARIGDGLDRYGFDHVLESPRPNGCRTVRVRGGLRERLRFFHLTDPAITRKRTFEGAAVKGDADLRVVSVEDLGVELPMYDLTTGTGDFLSNGVISHNCFARPSHTYLGLDAGRDFESVIVVKINAVERLRAELRAPRWTGAHVALGTNTDPYQRCEGRYRLTRGVIETLSTVANPFSVLTKGTLVTRDLDVLTDAAARGVCTNVSLSIPTLDEDVWRASEPGTPHPRRRLETVAELSDAGIRTGVMIAPIMPGLSDAPDQLERVVRGALEAGASAITPIVLHLRPGVREVFAPWLADARPDLVDRYRRLYRSTRAPRDEHARITGAVRDLVARFGGPRPPAIVPPPRDHRRAGHWPTDAGASEVPTPRPPEAEQLRLV